MAFAFSVRLIACLAAVFLSIAVAESDASSRSQANVRSNAETSCAWDCKFVDSKFGLEMKALISEFRLITVQLKYDQQEAKKCLNQTDLQNSSIKLAELWTWLTGVNPSHSGQNMSQHSFWFQKSLEGQIEVGVLCSLNPATDSNDTNPSLNDVIAMMLMEEVAKFADPPHSKAVFCYKLSAKNGSYVCVSVTPSNTAHNSTWQKRVFHVLVWVVVFISLWCFPLLCFLFTPTKFRDETTREVMIVLHGTSPESIRGWIANKFCSDDVRDVPVKLKLQKMFYAFVFFVIALGFAKLYAQIQTLLFPPAKIHEEAPFMVSLVYLLVVSFCLLMIRVVMRFGCHTLSPQQPCIICRVFGDEQNICHDLKNAKYYGRKEMEMHLLLLRSIVKRCLTQTFLKCAAFLECCCSSSLVKWLFLFLLFPFLIYDMLMFQNPQSVNMKRLSIFGFWETSFPLNGAFSLVFIIAINVLTTFRGFLLGLPNYLPYASLGAVTFFYVWKFYIPHPRKYNELSFKLFEHYKKKQDEDCTRLIPKDLYDEACEKLMPLKKSRGKLIATMFAILFGIFAVFVVITEAPRLDDQTKALGTLLALLLPKIGEMSFGKDPQVKKADDEDFDKSVASFVDDYISKSNPNANNNNDNGSSAGINSSTDITPLFPV